MDSDFNVQALTCNREAQFESTWRMAGQEVKGVTNVYGVKDENLPPDNTWIFYVHVPESSDENENIIVKPEAAPARDKLLPVERRAITFMPANMPPHQEMAYCKINLADPTGAKNKIGVRFEHRSYLPEWMCDFHKDMYPKEDVKTTQGRDGKALIVVVNPGDHEKMIKLFIATRAWPL